MNDNLEIIDKKIGQYFLHVYGSMDCPGGWESVYGPGEAIAIHYINRGKGMLKSEGITYSLSKGDIFMCEKGRKYIYTADETDPWQYCWIMLNDDYSGKLISARVSETGMTAGHAKNESFLCACYEQLWKRGSYGTANDDLLFEGILDMILFQAINSEPIGILKMDIDQNEDTVSREKRYINLASGYISVNYRNNITISDVSGYLGLNSTYFSKLFKKHMDITPNQYLTELRLRKAVYLLDNTDELVQNIASAVGYNYVHHFINAFKKHMNITPKQYRENLKNKKRSFQYSKL